MVLKTLSLWAAVKRTPLIKFRKGGPLPSAAHADASGSAGLGAASAQKPPQGNVTVSRGVIEDWQLPARYRRKPIDPVEAQWINCGGPP